MTLKNLQVFAGKLVAALFTEPIGHEFGLLKSSRFLIDIGSAFPYKAPDFSTNFPVTGSLL